MRPLFVEANLQVRLKSGLKTALYVAFSCVTVAAQDIKPSPLVKAPTIQPPPEGQIEVLPIRGNLYALMGAGNNIVISVGADATVAEALPTSDRTAPNAPRT